MGSCVIRADHLIKQAIREGKISMLPAHELKSTTHETDSRQKNVLVRLVQMMMFDPLV